MFLRKDNEMPGFFISNIENNVALRNYDMLSCVFDQIETKDFYIARRTLNKYMLDKCIKEDEEYIVVTDGVILNKVYMLKKYNAKDVFSLIKNMYRYGGETFFEEFRGSFSGALYIKKENKWIVYTNHYGDNTVYYYCKNGIIAIGTQVNYILDFLKENNIPISINENAVESLLSYGFLSNDFTYANEIMRLYPGHYFVWENGSFKINKYYHIKANKYDLSRKSEDEIIDELDERFRKAVKLEYDKDKEYGYKHIAQLSGGLDSRMSLWVAKELGYENILCMTFAQVGSLDEQIAKQIAKYLNVDLIYWPLDSAKHLTHIKEYISMNFGSALYGGIGAEKEIHSVLDMRRFGLIHTGQLGDVVISSFLKRSNELSDLTIGGTYSDIIKPTYENNQQFIDREDYLIFVRGFMGCCSSHLFSRNYSEVASPFLDIDFFDYCMSIPIEKRINHYIYKKWILKKYPDAGNFIWEKIGKRISEHEPNQYMVKLKHVLQDPRIILKKLGLLNYSSKLLKGMNPMDLWWEESDILRDAFNICYKDGISSVDVSEKIQKSIKILYEDGNTIEKMLVVTAISAINYYFEGTKSSVS